ncbi:MAG TPA: HU family DNA-binding protein, partial [Spirochaetota bacterium]|nr:HU family DNA-binding protein [Spirochaetota bacterium]
MSKNDFLKKFAAAADLDLKQAEKVIDQITGYIKNNLSAGKDVAIPHFGVFHFKKQKARQGRHPRTGAVINIPSRNSVRFTPGKQLKEKLNIKIAREAAAAILSDAKEQAAAVKSVSAEQTSAASGRTAGYDKSAAMYTEEEPELEIPELAPDDSAAAAGQDEEKKITATADTSSSGQSQVKEQTAGEQLPAVTDTGKSLKKS